MVEFMMLFTLPSPAQLRLSVDRGVTSVLSHAAPGHDGGVTSVLSQATPGHVFLILVCQQTLAIVHLPWSQTTRAELKGGD